MKIEMQTFPIKILSEEEVGDLSPTELKARREEVERATSEAAHEIVRYLAAAGYRTHRANVILERAGKEIKKIADETIVFQPQNRIDEYGKEVIERPPTAATVGGED